MSRDHYAKPSSALWETEVLGRAEITGVQGGTTQTTPPRRLHPDGFTELRYPDGEMDPIET